MSVRIGVLGGLEIRRDDTILDALPAQRIRCALLVYLAVEGKATRDRIMGLLWPDRPPDRARHSLSQTLYELRKELGDAWIRVHGEVLEVTEDVFVDATSFREAVEAERDEVALGAYKGSFLEGVDVADSPEFQAWVDRTRAGLGRLHRTAAARLVEARSGRGDLDGAIEAARSWVERDPLDDEGQHTLIALLGRSGRQSEALRQYDAYATALARELDVAPLEQTRALVEAMRARKTRAVSQDSPAPSDRAPPSGPPNGAAEDPETALTAFTTLVGELRRRRVTRVAIAYGVLALAVLQGTDLLLGPLGAPAWIQTALAVAAVLGFPVILVLAWVFDVTPGGIEFTRPERGSGVADRVARRALLAVVVVSVAGVAGIWFWHAARAPILDPDRVMVFPLVTPESEIVQASVGEDVATMIGHALDRTGPLRWIDGWTLLSPDQRADIRQLTDEQARALARSRQCAYYVQGRIVVQGETGTVFLDLRDAATGWVRARAQADGPRESAWQLGLEAVSGLLPEIVVTGTVPASYLDDLRRDPGAVASFLLGERQFRRADSRQAMDHYRAALDQDSTFVLAAIRGAQASAWAYDDEAVIRFAADAAAYELGPRDQALVEGLDAYARGRGDLAVESAERAIQVDSGSPVAWTLRGEALWHLASRTPNPDREVRRAFDEAYRLDPSAFGPLLHGLQLALMEGRLEDTRPLRERFLALSQDPGRDAQIRLMLRCARGEVSVAEWTRETMEHEGWTINAARLLAAGGRNVRCAEAGFRAVLSLAEGPSRTDRRRAFLGLYGILLAQGREAEALALLDAATGPDETLRAFVSEHADGGFAPGDPTGAPSYTLALDPDRTAPILDQRAQALMMMAAAGGRDVGTRAAEIAELQYDLLGRDFERARPDNFELYRLGIVEARLGHLGEVARITAHMDSVAEPSDPFARVLAQAVRGHEALARGDTVAAIGWLRGLRAEGPRDFLAWSYADPLALERILEARALLALGRPEADREALELASTLDGLALGYLPYVAESLELRIEAADRLGLDAESRELGSRLDALRRAGNPEGSGG